MTQTRNEKTAAAVQWLGTVLSTYSTGDWDQAQTADQLGAAIHDALGHDFGPVVRQLDTLRALSLFADAMRAEVDAQARHAKGRGATWQQIADALDLGSKQAAQARYGVATPVSLTPLGL